MKSPNRRFPVGAEVREVGTHFRVWAPASRTAAIVRYSAEGYPTDQVLPLEPETEGYFSGLLEEFEAGALYKIRLDSGEYPDPVSRFQPDGPHGPSQVVDSRFRWSDAAWQGVEKYGQILYEMHIGTFTPEGTWRAAAEQLEELARLGITALEIMPVADFPGRFGWGYDGVNLYAPTRLYGTPDDFRAFIDRAHSVGIGVILDVVYNHLGPDGNYLACFSPRYFSTRYKNEWGEPLNFDGPESTPVREFFIENAAYWIEEYHIDGLRLDATQQIFDRSPEHLVTSISKRARQAAGERHVFLVAENEPQRIRLVRSIEEGGHGLDALWNDDFHHSAIVALTGKNEAYYTDYRGEPQEFISAAKYGYLYQGQWYKWQSKARGTASLDAHPASFVTYIQNHDQIANSLWGHRIHELTTGGGLRAMTALLLLGPSTPMLFQGQEFAASSPFLYFADHDRALAQAVARGRQEFLSQFPSIAALEKEVEQYVAGPEREETFQRCKLDFAERERHAPIYRLHRDLIQLRRTDPVFSTSRRGGVDGAVLSASAFVLRFFGATPGDDRLLFVNFGADHQLDILPEPLLAPPAATRWELQWSSEDPQYDGAGTPPLECDGAWRMAGHAAIVMKSMPFEPSPSDDDYEHAGP